MAPFHARVVLDGDQHALADLAFLDLDVFLLAVRCLTAGASVGRDFWAWLVKMEAEDLGIL